MSQNVTDSKGGILSLQVHRQATNKITTQESLDQQATTIRVLQICRAIIHNQRVLGFNIINFQDWLVENDLMSSALELLSSNNSDIVRESLALLNLLFEGGNRRTQKYFISLIRKQKVQGFFQSISSRIDRATDSIVEVCS